MQSLRAATDKLRLFGSMALDFPDNGRGWVTHAARTATALLRAQKFDAVITSGPPHSVHFAGLLATSRTRVPHVIDMRDPWSHISPEWPGHVIKSWLFGQLERFIFTFRHCVVVNTREFADMLRMARPRISVTLVPNATDTESLPARSSDLFEQASIAYAGTVYIGRSFSALLAAMESLRRDRPDAARRLKLRIAGQMDEVQAEQFQSELARRGLTDMVELCGPLPRAEALALLRRSHLVLVLAQGQPTQVPAKLYECVGMGAPTLVISEPTSAASREARRIGGIVIEPDDIIGLRHLLDDLVDGHVPITMSPAAPISYDFVAHEMDAVLQCAAASAR